MGLEKYPSKRSNPESERQTWYVFASICNLALISLISKL